MLSILLWLWIWLIILIRWIRIHDTGCPNFEKVDIGTWQSWHYDSYLRRRKNLHKGWPIVLIRRAMEISHLLQRFAPDLLTTKKGRKGLPQGDPRPQNSVSHKAGPFSCFVDFLICMLGIKEAVVYGIEKERAKPKGQSQPILRSLRTIDSSPGQEKNVRRRPQRTANK